MRTRLVGSCMTLLLAITTSWAQTPLGSAFTYQGQLKDDGAPAGGLHDLRFQLFNASTLGAQVGTTQCADNVNVAEGLFTVPLDFGAAAFNGDERWLEIGVRADNTVGNCAGGAYIPLLPRQRLSAALYALQTRGLYVDPDLKVGVGTTTPSARLTVNGGLHVFDNPGQGISLYSDNISFRSSGNEDPAYQYTYSPEQHDFYIGGGSAMSITSTGNVGIGIAVPLARMHAQTASPTGRGVYGLATAATGVTFGVFGQSASTSGHGVTGVASAATGATYGVYAESESTSGRGVFGLASAGTGVTYGGRFESGSTSGIGIFGVAGAPTGTTFGVYGESASTTGRAVYGRAAATTGSAHGVEGESASVSGRGVYGLATATTGITRGVYGVSESNNGGRGVQGYVPATSGTTYGVLGRSDSTSGYGIFGQALATTGTNYGVYGESASTGGTGVKGVSTTGAVGVKGEGGYGVYGSSDSTTGQGVVGLASANTGETYGGRFEIASGTDLAVGVFGAATATTGRTYGGRFESAGASGRGVFGKASATTGSTNAVRGENYSIDGVGVYGGCFASSGTTYGVYGNGGSPAGYGVYAGGSLGASGTKSFRIDHPDDPENKYLLHYCAESPEVINFYSETVTLDERGEALVELPRYFAKINTRPRYQLTAVGAPMPMLHVAAEVGAAALIAGAKAEPGETAPLCSFRIAGGAPGAKVSWEVKAVRNDRWVQKRGAPVEVEKQGLEKGTHQHPELYGQPPEKGMNYEAEREHPSTAPLPDIGQD